MLKFDVISTDVPPEQRPQRGTYRATITVGGSFVEFGGIYELPKTALVADTIRMRLEGRISFDIKVEEDQTSQKE